MEDWGGALEVDGLPSSASIDELSVLLSELANCRQHHILLSSRGASSVGTCLVLLPSAGTAAAVADLLDSYPLSGGLLEARPCADPAAWVQRHVMQHLSNIRSSSLQASVPQAAPLQRVQPPPVQLPPVQLPPAQPLPLQPQPPAGSASGLTAHEAEAREAQRMLQELQAQNDMNQLFSSGGGSSGWGDEQEGGWAGEQEGDWEGGGEGSAASDSEGEWNQVGGRAGGKSASRRGGGASSCRIMVRNMALAVDQATVRSFFQQFGAVQEAVKLPDARYAFVHYHSADDAAAAIAAVDGQLVPQLNPAVPVQAHYRDRGDGSGGSAAGAAPRRAGSSGGQHPISAVPTGKLFVGHIRGGVTIKDLEDLFGRFGPVFDLELRRANGEGRSDQWGFVNFRRKQDAMAAFEELQGVVVPGITEGNRKPLKLQFRSA